MRKNLIHPETMTRRPEAEEKWLALEEIARVEVTSEDPSFPIESALAADTGPGWHATKAGEQSIRIIFDAPTTLHRIRLEFSETELERTQEYTVRWSRKEDAPLEEIVRQQFITLIPVPEQVSRRRRGHPGRRQLKG